MRTIKVSSEGAMPAIALGTHKLVDAALTCRYALDIGYTHFDTATAYNNHHQLAAAFQSVPRERIFITTKINETDIKEKGTLQSIENILCDLKSSYIDLLLIHGPRVPILETLEKMLEAQEKGWVRSIGVSNFAMKHLELIKNAGLAVAVNQIEVHPYFSQEDLISYCCENKMHIMAYRPLCKGKVSAEPLLQEIGKRHSKTASQIALAWGIQRGYCVVPRASTRERLQENLDIFDISLTSEETKEIDSLHTGTRTCEGSWADF